MKKLIFFSLIGMLSLNCTAQADDLQSIKEVITSFSKAGDNNDVKAMESLLDANYRIVMNQLFGSQEVSAVNREFYLSKIESKEWGGDSRTLTFGNVMIVGKNAVAEVTQKGNKSTMHSLIALVKDANGTWKLVSDTPSLD